MDPETLETDGKRHLVTKLKHVAGPLFHSGFPQYPSNAALRLPHLHLDDKLQSFKISDSNP